ncbi:bifunctional oligoribonuclease/PAP phosphatase NrnA [soil metagenome]
MTTGHETFADIRRISRKIRDAITSSERPVVVTHARVDADAAGSAIGMGYICTAIGVAPPAVRAGDFQIPGSLEFVDPDLVLAEDDLEPLINTDLVIFVDCADQDRAGIVSQVLAEREVPYGTINIDHHVTNTRFGDINLVVPEAAATCEILPYLLTELDTSMTPQLATALLAGVYGDTLGLKTPSTTPKTMHVCADLYEAGAYLDLIVDHLFRKKPMSTVLLWGEVQSRAAWQGRLVWSLVTNEMLDRAGSASAETEGLVNFLAGVEGAFAAALVQESDDGWRVSLRSTTEEVDVSDLAGHFGGGGHPRAAGCRLEPGREAVDKFLSFIEAEFDKMPDDAGTRPEHASLIR